VFYFKRRLSVAAAMTVLALIVTAFIVTWSTEVGRTGWQHLDDAVLSAVYILATFAAWEATRRGHEPSELAPIVAAIWVFIFLVALLLYLTGARASAPAPIATITIPYPADLVLLVVSLVFAVYSAVVGFWLVTRK